MQDQMLPVRARFVRQLDGFQGDARLYELSEPVKVGWEPWNDDEPDERESTDYVVVSAVNAFGMGDETYIFAANAEGEVLTWNELPGSFKGDQDHAEAIRNAGWVLDEQ